MPPQINNSAPKVDISLKSTFFKIVLVITGITFLETVINALFINSSFYWIAIIFPLLLGAAAVFSIFRFLSPLNQISGSVQHLLTKLNLKSDAGAEHELAQLHASINQISQFVDTQQLKTTQDSSQLALERNKFQSIISSLADGIIVLSLNREVMYLNKKAEQLIGYTLPEINKKHVEEIITIEDPSGQKIPSSLYCPVNPSSEYQIDEDQNTYLVLTGKNNLKSYVKVNCSAIASPVQTDLGYILILRNMKHQKDMESIQLDFVSMASHELRTPLTSIKGYLSVFMEENKEKFNPDQLQMLDRITISTQQLASLVENLLNVSKVERGAFSLNLTATDWSKMLTQAVDENKLFGVQKSINVSLEPLPQLPMVLADNIRIVEVLNNLIANAINYNKPGGWVKVSAKIEGKEVITTVADSGLGMPPEAIQHLFTKFFRVAGALDKSSNSKGTGLGLFLSKSIIDLHHGKIWVESKVGEGSQFHFSLPIAESGKATVTGSPIPNAAVQDLLNSVK